MKQNVQNVPGYAMDYPYWVVLDVDGELWFWGAWNNKSDAEKVAYNMTDARVV